MKTTIAVLRHTPAWVYVLFAYLVWQGVRALRPRLLRASRIVIAPGLFILWGLAALVQADAPATTIAPLWLGGAVLGGLLGLATGPRLLAVDHPRNLISLPGSRAPLTRNLVIFGLHYGLNVAAALLPWRAQLVAGDIAVSGASAGYFVGWLVVLIRRYHHAPDADLSLA
jgi:hypothetical protein